MRFFRLDNAFIDDWFLNRGSGWRFFISCSLAEESL